MENCGGARPECALLTVEVRLISRWSDSRVADAGVRRAPADGARCAHWETVRGRQQSRWQHPGGALNSKLCEERSCIGFRRQQACGVGAEIARATGANTPTSSRISTNLAVRRCMTVQIPLRRSDKGSVIGNKYKWKGMSRNCQNFGGILSIRRKGGWPCPEFDCRLGR
jgi:hypothetical protein